MWSISGIDSLEIRTGENPVHAPSAAPAGEEMDRAFVARGDRMRGAKNVVQRRRRGRLRSEQRAVGRGAAPVLKSPVTMQGMAPAMWTIRSSAAAYDVLRARLQGL